jgi:adenosylhomocysteine nucleosidase
VGLIVESDTDGTVVVLTALNLEYQAIRVSLTGVRRIDHPAGTLFEAGELPGGRGRIVLAVTGQGNAGAAVLTERAIAMFQPRALLFVGVAGALSDDLELGDVVVATKVYSYHGGKEGSDGFFPRPQCWEIPHQLDQLARHVHRTQPWVDRLPAGPSRSVPAVHFKPIAAGEIVLDARTASLGQELRRTYGDAVAIEMESAGVSQAAHFKPFPTGGNCAGHF